MDSQIEIRSEGQAKDSGRHARRVVRRFLDDYLAKPPASPPVSLSKSQIIKLAEQAVLSQPDAVAERIVQELRDDLTSRLVVALQTVNCEDKAKRDFLAVTPTDVGNFIGAAHLEQELDVQSVPGLESQRDATGREDEIIAMVRNVVTTDGEEVAVSHLYATYHPLILAAERRDFVRANRILRQVKVDEFPVSVLVGFLMMTFAHKDKFSGRGDLFKRVKVKVASSTDADEVMPYLVDLE